MEVVPEYQDELLQAYGYGHFLMHLHADLQEQPLCWLAGWGLVTR